MRSFSASFSFSSSLSSLMSRVPSTSERKCSAISKWSMPRTSTCMKNVRHSSLHSLSGLAMRSRIAPAFFTLPPSSPSPPPPGKSGCASTSRWRFASSVASATWLSYACMSADRQ